ncbi:MAG TPA: LuxR C-terminal-related transcriptional regulator [Sphingomonadaceae bacterium]|nr:LuxR C-terminal-related transcriptional regulator [Sphingomonadaceae bacterium]
MTSSATAFESFESTPEEPTSVLLLRWLAGEPVARLLVAPDRTVLWISEAAAELLDGSSELCQRDGLLVAADATRTSQLDTFLSGVGAEGAFLCIKDDKCGYLLICARPIEAGEMPVIGLRLCSGAAHHQPVYAGYSVPFALTCAEERVVSALLSGRTAEQMSSATGPSLETVRTHIKNVYAKVGVASREALFFRLAPFRVW